MDNEFLLELQDAPTVGSVVGPQHWIDDSELRLSGSIFSQMRVLDGKFSGLNSHRFGGSAKVIPGLVRQNGLPVPVERVLVSRARREGSRHHDHRMLVTIPLRTAAATIEWLLLEDDLPYAIRRLTSSHHAYLLSEETVS
ncbi:hypothetical protein CLV47_12642 [Antricoccus suffuscus]|uniref:Uncharacterized protein n=1 Tax=Antricoccus suffuscus TaxID=1629062 RepID=A0A2T0Z9D7_9ACTN|nr:hypothetical protein [Antricoccus suffuscus]PRZ32768.1 hypothetical protein CLV47_12642 [Antricoccus suffuscus]